MLTRCGAVQSRHLLDCHLLGCHLQDWWTGSCVEEWFFIWFEAAIEALQPIDSRTLAMLFTFILIDKPDSAHLRQSMRPAHKAYLANMAERIAFAGPLTHDDGQTMLGSLLVMDFPERNAAHAWLADEPFCKAGLYGSTAVHAFVNLWPQKSGFPPAA